MKLKYIISKYGNFTIFTDGSAHNEMARGLHGTPVSAGFCYLNVNPENKKISIECFGESISLKLKSNPNDSEFLTNKINNHYD